MGRAPLPLIFMDNHIPPPSEERRCCAFLLAKPRLPGDGPEMPDQPNCPPREWHGQQCVRADLRTGRSLNDSEASTVFAFQVSWSLLCCKRCRGPWNKTHPQNTGQSKQLHKQSWRNCLFYFPKSSWIIKSRVEQSVKSTKQNHNNPPFT